MKWNHRPRRSQQTVKVMETYAAERDIIALSVTGTPPVDLDGKAIQRGAGEPG